MRAGLVNVSREAAEHVYHCLLEMGAQQINPVLAVIADHNTIQRDKKYPAELLQFNGAGWRAYYHCHANQPEIDHLFENEHGHFHLFTRLDSTEASWSHLVALSMDEFGQPLRWFMVNHWVTGENWSGAETLRQKLVDIPYSSQSSLLEEWLLSILALYQQDILQMLTSRDACITGEQFLQDRKHYLLEEKGIILKQKLEQAFTAND